jgi:hypothetical protein
LPYQLYNRQFINYEIIKNNLFLILKWRLFIFTQSNNIETVAKKNLLNLSLN